jgi:hypothetical protein
MGSGKRPIRLKTLERLASYLKRPLAVFFLSEPPREIPLETSFRILPREPQSFSKDLRLAIRRVRRWQSITNELLGQLGESPETKIRKANLDNNPFEIAGAFKVDKA